MDICLATEDQLSETVAEKLVFTSNHDLRVDQRFRQGGAGYLRKRLNNFNQIARHSVPVLLITDLDTRPCAPDLVDAWSGGKRLSRNLLFRVAVRETEAWLLADRQAFAKFVGVSVGRLPRDPEGLMDPKQELLNVVSRSRKRRLRDAILPEPGARSKVGLGYNATLSAFVAEHWDPVRASTLAPSLAKTMRRLDELGMDSDSKP